MEMSDLETRCAVPSPKTQNQCQRAKDTFMRMHNEPLSVKIVMRSEVWLV